MSTLPIVIRGALLLIVLGAAWFDWRSRRIPNWLNLSGLILGLGLNLLFFQLQGAKQSSTGMLLALAIYLPLYLLRGMGAGDVKLMAAIGSLVGPSQWLSIFLVTALAGGALGLLHALRSGRLKQTLWNTWFVASELKAGRLPHRSNSALDIRNAQALRMPHGVVIALSCLLTLALRVPSVLN